jgi:uncharacterized membrane protein
MVRARAVRYPPAPNPNREVRVLYDLLLFVHIVAAIVWIGGAIQLNLLGTRAVRSRDPARMVAIARESEWVGQRIIAPGGAVILAMGLIMVAVSEAWTIGQTWIILALIGFGLTFLAGALFFGPESGRVGKAIDARGPEDAEVRRRIRRILVVGRFDILLLFLIVADMVFKPGL